MKKIVKLDAYKEKKKASKDFIEEIDTDFMNFIQSDIAPIMLLKLLNYMPEQCFIDFIDGIKEIKSSMVGK